MADARFEDGEAGALRLQALDAEGLTVVSALAQDSVFAAANLRWDKRRRRFAVLLNRFRWEDRGAAEQAGRGYERVRSLLVVEDVTRVASTGIDRGAEDMVLSLLAIGYEPGEDGTGRLILTLAGDGAVALDVEALDVLLKDVTQPYLAPSGKVPGHPE